MRVKAEVHCYRSPRVAERTLTSTTPTRTTHDAARRSKTHQPGEPMHHRGAHCALATIDHLLGREAMREPAGRMFGASIMVASLLDAYFTRESRTF
jgi:hypothetical protein